MDKKHVEGLMFTLASLESSRLTTSEQLLAIMAYNALNELLKRIEADKKPPKTRNPGPGVNR